MKTDSTISELVKQLNPRRSAVCAATAAAVKILKIAKLGTKMSSFRSTCLSINLMLLTISLVEAEVHHICFLHLKPELKNKSLHHFNAFRLLPILAPPMLAQGNRVALLSDPKMLA